MVKRLNWTRTSEADQAEGGERRRWLADTMTWPEGIGPAGGAGDPGIVIAVDNVVVGAAGAAHDEGADEEQREVPGLVWGLPSASSASAWLHQQGNKQQPGADGAVEAGEAGIRQRPGRRPTVDPIAGRGVGDSWSGFGGWRDCHVPTLKGLACVATGAD